MRKTLASLLFIVAACMPGTSAGASVATILFHDGREVAAAKLRLEGDDIYYVMPGGRREYKTSFKEVKTISGWTGSVQPGHTKLDSASAISKTPDRKIPAGPDSQAEKEIKAVWAGMKAALAAGDLEGALKHYSMFTCEVYRMQFQSSARAGLLPKTVAEMGDLLEVTVTGDTAEGEVRSVVFGMNTAYKMSFVREKGAWKIESL